MNNTFFSQSRQVCSKVCFRESISSSRYSSMLGSNIRYLSLRSHFSRCEHQIDHDMHPRQGWKGGQLCVRNDGRWENTHTTSSACALLTSSSALGGCRWLASSRRVSTMRHASRKQAAVAFKNKAPF